MLPGHQHTHTLDFSILEHVHTPLLDCGTPVHIYVHSHMHTHPLRDWEPSGEGSDFLVALPTTTPPTSPFRAATGNSVSEEGTGHRDKSVT